MRRACSLPSICHPARGREKLSGRAACGFSPDNVMEQHAALNWLTGFDNIPDTAQDDIDTPT
ncbi:hypothetical protein FMA36_14100 [Komagataeibacter xylinus]|uniref:Uncharacterized protein n=1 Tax=Komagataeibacter xylinus TaxID=28448 RepID=A0A857FTH6_KOMXY|nr:hypothetical protein FMA36_14100 [Komagataeibacter xylinus]